MIRQAFSFVISVLLMANGFVIQANHLMSQTSVILVLCDDLGYGDLGCYGATDIRTPNLDRMAAEGTRFTDFSVVASLCTPSRAALMTGKYPGRVGLATGVLRPDAINGLAHDEVTLADIAKSKGYRTGCIGKWHLGFVDGMLPMQQGFDEYFGTPHNLDKLETMHFENEGGMPIYRNEKVIERPADPAKMTDLYTQEALRFIQANYEQPFFLYLSHAMPHLPLGASPRFLGKSKRNLYGDVIEELDDSMGQLLATIRNLGIADRTLVLFTSDNGPERKTDGSAGKLRGTKHTVYEGGIRVPFIAWWPTVVPSGRENLDFISGLDLLPTMAALIDAELPETELDGFNMLPVLLGQPDVRSPRSSLYAKYGYRDKRLESIRLAEWKLHLKEPIELYNLDADLSESQNIADAYPGKVAELRKLAKSFADLDRQDTR